MPTQVWEVGLPSCLRCFLFSSEKNSNTFIEKKSRFWNKIKILIALERNCSFYNYFELRKLYAPVIILNSFKKKYTSPEWNEKWNAITIIKSHKPAKNNPRVSFFLPFPTILPTRVPSSSRSSPWRGGGWNARSPFKAELRRLPFLKRTKERRHVLNERATCCTRRKG